jgi:CubicO group peptidase (beta-lactamase class C family)
LVLVWSATKGPASACIFHALIRFGVPLTLPVAALWPEFAASGKGSIRIVDVMSHRAGLSAISDRGVRFSDHDAVVEALARQAPLWSPGSAHGYSPRVVGYLLEEICRRVSGMTLADYWRTTFAEPMGLEFWMGLPESEHPRVANMLPPRLTSQTGEKTAFERAFAEPGSLTNLAFSTPSGLTGATAMNRAEIRSASFPAFGGIGSASAVAKFYGMLACGGTHEGKWYFSEESLLTMQRRVSDGFDLVLQRETAFSCGLMLDPLHGGEKIRSVFGPSLAAFGHPGAGGSLAFADPMRRLGFAYVMNQMEPGALPRERTLRLVRALYADLAISRSF